jgi:Protein of unknown function (DUF2817)
MMGPFCTRHCQKFGDKSAMTTAPETFFATNYFEAREMFLAAARDSGATVTSALHPTAKGPNERDIYMDCAVLGPPDAPGALVVISGTHGPEGYCGSGVQVGLLREGLASQWAQTMRVILIHAHNAYGFAWDTRFNEDNIDLNRNYLETFEAPLPINENYRLLAQWAAPALRDAETMQGAERALLGFAGEHGFPALQAALSGGQYEYPKGVYYGGVAPSWSNVTLHKFLKQACAGASKIVSLDMHTGLGPFGHGEIITEAAPGSSHYENQASVWGGDICSTKDGSSVSADLSGTMDNALVRAFEPAWSACVAVEFGTIDPMSVFRATGASSWLHCYGDPASPQAAGINTEMRAAFYPETDEWKRLVWARSADVIGKAAAALSA